MPHVALLRSLHPDAEARLRAEPGFTVEVVHNPVGDELRDAMTRAEAVVVRATPINAEFLGFSPKLSIVARHGVGYDAVDVPELTKRGIPLTVTADANALSVAEHALMLMLTIAKQIKVFDENTRAFKWSTTDAPTAYDLSGMTVLVVGFGRIGGRVARLCHAFGMDVLVCDPNVPMNTVKGAGFRYAKTLEEGLAEADWVTMHCPSNAENRGMVNAEFLGAMKPGARLINTARGTLVQEAALASALKSGHVAAAGLDVFWEEPVAKSNPLLGAPNVVMTPHSAAGTVQGMRRMGLSAVSSIIGHFKGEVDPDMVINKEVLRLNR
ncbi:NAD(P)-dependent oxidoreductase [Sabulicella glaciei]|uniref:Hydroxyacid dehydrogenase n=1 Tax=Sabulicella glaciei TaxID=2984948 RepID=A0ABT3NUV5_9PROT|nr:hydroxyacid dehydrogenase [Roseococcus sp. MDT2-1-1]MCW8085949.1 hydroxyacid dehydrogenase [Roseococcus sp. MDT2-1-1]